MGRDAEDRGGQRASAAQLPARPGAHPLRGRSAAGFGPLLLCRRLGPLSGRPGGVRVGSPRGRSPFLDAFRARGCYLVDLCLAPVDRLPPTARRRLRRQAEPRLVRFVRRARPETVIVVVRSIAPNVRRALARAGFVGRRAELAYPGRWKRHRDAFRRDLPPLLRG